MKKDKVDKNQVSVERVVEEKPPVYPFNISFDLVEKARTVMQPDAFLVADDLCKHLLESLDAALMAKRVETEFRAYGIGASLQTMVNAINISAITNDPGDNADALPQMPQYDYLEECAEPQAAVLDKHAEKNQMGDNEKMKHHMSVAEFKAAYMANVGGGNRQRRGRLSPNGKNFELSASKLRGGRSSRASVGSRDHHLSKFIDRVGSPSKMSTARRGSAVS